MNEWMEKWMGNIAFYLVSLYFLSFHLFLFDFISPPFICFLLLCFKSFHFWFVEGGKDGRRGERGESWEGRIIIIKLIRIRHMRLHNLCPCKICQRSNNSWPKDSKDMGGNPFTRLNRMQIKLKLKAFPLSLSLSF